MNSVSIPSLYKVYTSLNLHEKDEEKLKELLLNEYILKNFGEFSINVKLRIMLSTL